MAMKILILMFFAKLKKGKITRGHNFTLVKKQSRLDVTLIFLIENSNIFVFLN